MANKIGEMLVERSLLTIEQVNQGLESQKFYGGRVGSLWVQLGYLQEKDLLEVLSVQKKAKPAKASLLKAVTKATLDLLPVKVAVRYKVVPLVKEGRRLSVAMCDPNDLLALDELQFISGCVVEPFLATERTVLNALEKYYGIQQQKRDTVTSDLKASAPTAKATPQAPPSSAAPKAAAGSDPLFLDDVAKADAEAARKFWAQKSGNTDPGHLAAAKSGAPPPPPAAAGPAAAAGPPASAPVAADEVMDGNDLLVDDSETVATQEAPNPLEEAARKLARADIRDDIADVLLWCTEGLFQRSALFIFQKPRTLGWTGQGEGLSPEMVRRVLVPVEDISIFTLVRDTQNHYQGPLPKNAGNEKLVESLGGKWPPGVLVIPFGIKGRPLAFGCLYAEDELAQLATIDLPLLFRLLQKSGLAFEMLVLRSKIIAM